ncbi:hypothetical protein [uncultured Sulfitobacter sp.]|uniref:hypothetical protein n=1 Tax=uncultured Sulfitobacter sp. TaxID=191468 RepID=UPI0026372655|nr:hypothetical protein [uncultured Sulfitobacter sp.]
MSDKTAAELAAEVSMLMQLDRTRHHVSTQVDMAALANIPAHIAQVFEAANAVQGELSPAQLYALVNKRISEMQAQVYLMRLELESRNPHDPASIYEDPMVIAAYGARNEALGAREKSFSFGPEILADGWYPMETSEDVCHRWMRPGEMSVACVPHLGNFAQQIVIEGYVMKAAQMEGLSVQAVGQSADIEITEQGNIARFRATLDLMPEHVRAANYLPVEFRVADFVTPNDVDTRLLGANIHSFVCRPAPADTDANAEPAA